MIAQPPESKTPPARPPVDALCARLANGEFARWAALPSGLEKKLIAAGREPLSETERHDKRPQFWRQEGLAALLDGDSPQAQAQRGAWRWANRVARKAWSRTPKESEESALTQKRRWQVEGEGAAAWIQWKGRTLVINVELPLWMGAKEESPNGLALWEKPFFDAGRRGLSDGSFRAFESPAGLGQDPALAWGMAALKAVSRVEWELMPEAAIEASMESRHAAGAEFERVWALREQQRLRQAIAAGQTPTSADASPSEQRKAARL